MQTYQKVHADLLALETQYFALAKVQYLTPNACATGAIQFAAIDTLFARDPKPKPVVCVVGINYTQQPKRSLACFHYLGGVAGLPKVEQSDTGSRNAVAHLIAAYNRNTADWTASSGKGAFYPNEIGPFGSASATPRRLGSHDFLEVKDEFILAMTNRCPCITALKWEEQIRM